METVKEQIVEILEEHRKYPDFVDSPPDDLAGKIISLITKTEPVDEVPCSVGLVAPVVDDEMLVRALRKAIEVGLLPAYGSQDQYLKNWDRMKEVLQAAVGN